jgi:predicted nucleotidyltransferase
MVNTANLELVQPILKTYVDKLNQTIEVTEAYLFGSYARGTATADSDIDILVVSPDFNGNPIQDRLLLMKARRGVDLRIEPHPMHPANFSDNNPFVKKIWRDMVPVD